MTFNLDTWDGGSSDIPKSLWRSRSQSADEKCSFSAMDAVGRLQCESKVEKTSYNAVRKM